MEVHDWSSEALLLAQWSREGRVCISLIRCIRLPVDVWPAFF